MSKLAQYSTKRLTCGQDARVELIFAACREADFPEPVIEFESSGLWVNFPFAKEIIPRTSGQPREKTLEKTPEKTPEKILAVLAAHPDLSLAEVAARIGKSNSAVERAAAKLVKSGRLKRIGPAKGGHWEVSK